MSADGVINDYTQPVVFSIYCYSCGAVINLDKPAEGHAKPIEQCIADGYGERALKFGWNILSSNFEV